MTVEYEYRCRSCGHTDVVGQLIKETRDTTYDFTGLRPHCPRWPDCRGRLHRVWNANVTTRSVPGFHAHDYRGKMKGPRSEAGTSID